MTNGSDLGNSHEATRHLVTELALREARALTMTPKLEVRVNNPETQFLVKVKRCPWCGAKVREPYDCDVLLPLREMALISTAEERVARLPILTMLSCEELTARSLLILSRIGELRPGASRFVSRAVFWSSFVESSTAELSDHDIAHGIRRLNDEEQWLDGFLNRAEEGIGRLHPNNSGPDLVLPISSRIRPSVSSVEKGEDSLVSRTDRLLASMRSFHFLTPHAKGRLAAELNTMYRSVRLIGVREAL